MAGVDENERPWPRRSVSSPTSVAGCAPDSCQSLIRIAATNPVRGGRSFVGGPPHEPPFLRGLILLRRAGDLAHPPCGASQLRDSTGIAPASPLQRRSGAMHPAQRMGELTPEAVEDAACTVEDHPRRCRARPWRRYCPVGLHPTRWRPPSWSAVRTPCSPSTSCPRSARGADSRTGTSGAVWTWRQSILCGVVVEDRVWRHPMARRGLRSPVIHEC
jgi:hypothetical protein